MPPVLPGEGGKNPGTESRSSPQDGRKEGRKKGEGEGGEGQEEYEGATSHGGGHSSFRGLHLVVFYSSAHREYATLLFRRDAVPDICCSLSSSPQQGICIIIISPRPSRKLELRTGATIRIRSFGPVVVVAVVVKERGEGGERVERKGRTAKLASVNHDALLEAKTILRISSRSSHLTFA